jgi:hypothetical protein
MKLYKKLIDELEKIPTRDLYNRPQMIQEKINVMRLKLEGYFQGLKEAKTFSSSPEVQVINFDDDDLLTDDINPSEKGEVTHLWTDPNPPRIQGPQ